MNYLCNSILVGMFPMEDFTLLRIRRVAPEDIPLSVVSTISNPNITMVISNILGRKILPSNVKVKIDSNDTIYLVKYRGPHIQEGCQTPPKGATIELFEITSHPSGCSGCIATSCNSCNMMNWTHGE